MVKQTTLENGVRIVTERVDTALSATMGIWFKVGSRDEAEPMSGVSHMIEHMAFKGTADRSPLDIAREIDLLGGMANAFTSKEYTCFHSRALPEHLGRMSGLLTDLVMNSVYSPDELERERQVILSEISMVEDTPDELVHVLFAQNYWPNHALGRAVLGTAQTVAGMSRDDILAYQGASYLPQQVVISAVGKLSHRQVVDLVSPEFSRLPAGKTAQPRLAPASQPGFNYYNRPTEQVHIALGSPAPSTVSDDRFPSAILNTVMGGNMSSRLFQEVREKRGLAYSVFSYLSSYSDIGMLGVYLGVEPERTVEAFKVVQSEMARLVEEPLPDYELEEAKQSLKGAILLGAESPDSHMSRLAKNLFNFGRPVPLSEVIERIEAVGAADVQRLAGESLAGDKLAATFLGPLDPDALVGELGR